MGAQVWRSNSLRGKTLQSTLDSKRGLLGCCQITHANAEPTLIDVDEPDLRDDYQSHKATPQRYLQYNSHIPTAVRSTFQMDAWQSPAFLKRTHLLPSEYDPFALTEDDFPDNDRRKRTRFGRGSSEWKFTQRSPSPEKALQGESPQASTPSKVKPYVALDRDEDKIRPRASHEDPKELTIESEHIEPTVSEAVPNGVRANHSEVQETIPPVEDPIRSEKHGGIDNSHAQSELVYEHGVEILNGPKDNSQILKDDEDIVASIQDTHSNIAQPFAGLILPSEDRYGDVNKSAAEETNDSGGGPDTEALEHQKDSPDQQESEKEKLLSETTHLASTGASLLEDNESVITSVPPVPSSQVAVPLSANTPKSSPKSHAYSQSDVESISQMENSDVVMLDRPASETEFDGAVFAPLRPLSKQASPRETPEPMPEHKGLDFEMTAIDRSDPHTNEGDGDVKPSPKNPTNIDRSPSRSSSIEPQPPETNDEARASEVSDDSRNTQQTTNSEQQPSDELTEHGNQDAVMSDHHLPPSDHQIEQKVIPDVSAPNVNDEETTTRQELLHPPAWLSQGQMLQTEDDVVVEPEKAKSVHIEVIDLESESQDDTQQRQLSHLQDENQFLDGFVHNDLFVDRIDISPDPIPSDNNKPQEANVDEPVSLPNLQSPQTEPVNVELPSAEAAAASQQSPDGDSSVAAQEERPYLTGSETSVRPEADAALDFETSDKDETSSIELPTTIPDSVKEGKNDSRLLTPDTTQPTSFVSQPSSTSLQLEQENGTLPTPGPTQREDDNILLASDDLSSQIASLEVDPTRARAADDDKSPAPVERVAAQAKPPTLIEKLRAMRRLSSQTPRKSGDMSALSPWFTPKRSSIVVPDSETESAGESSSEHRQRKGKVKVKPASKILRTPAKEKPLAESFIRSSPSNRITSPLPSSPGYEPYSQPAPPGFRTSTSYYSPLKALQLHFATMVDILAIVLSATSVTRARYGPKDYHQSIYLVDPSALEAKPPIITLAQIFRPKSRCFPNVEIGDALLLRDFKVESFQRQPSLLSTSSSAWAVFRVDTDVQVSGPPVEFGAEERGFVRGLRQWWSLCGEEKKALLKEKVSKATEEEDKKPKSNTTQNSYTKKKSEHLNGDMKKEVIEGLGVDLPGSQRSNEKPHKEFTREPSLGMDGVIESVEPPKRVLRPRGAKGKAEKSESPTKAMDRRSGTVFTGGLGEPDSE